MASGQRTFVLHPFFKQRAPTSTRHPEAALEEGIGLAHAIDLDIIDTAIVPILDPKPSTLMGKGKVEELKGRIADGEIGVVIVNGTLSPIQQRNLEKEWNCKVIDRTALILEIF